MNTWRISVVAALALVAGALAYNVSAQTGPAGAPPATRVAVCDIVQVFNNYQRAKDLTNDLNKKREEVKAEDEKRQKAIEALQMEVEQLKIGSSEYEKRQSELQQKVIERKTWREFQDAQALREHTRLTRDMYEEMVGMVSAVAREEGYHLVLYTEHGDIPAENTQETLRQIERRKVLYSDPSIDLSEKVLMRLNGAYKSGK